MGVQLNIRRVDFFLPADKKADAVAAIKDLLNHPELMHGGLRSKPEFSWVDSEELVQAESIREALNAWGWMAKTDKAGNVVDLSFESDKLGDEDALFGALAPFVLEGSEIQALADDEPFRWHFVEGRCHQDREHPAFDNCPSGGD